MTTELTKAAQQALEACPFCGGKNIKVHSYSDAVIGGEPDAFAQCHDCSVTGPNGKTEADAAESWNTRALTQRPAAQSEREADGLPLIVAGAIFDFAGFMTTRSEVIEVGSTAEAGPVADLVKEWAELRGLDLADAAVLSWQLHITRASLPAPQQATPEPVGEVVAWQRRDRNIVTGEWSAWREDDDIEEELDPEWAERRPLFARPAPGVPEGWRNVIAGTLKTDPWDSARVADYNSGWNDCQRKTLRGLERLAAARAKGGAA